MSTRTVATHHPLFTPLGRLLVPHRTAQIVREYQLQAQEDARRQEEEETALAARAAAQVAACEDLGERWIPVFDTEALQGVEHAIKERDSDKASVWQQAHNEMSAHRGFREIPESVTAPGGLVQLAQRFPNFEAAIEFLQTDLALASVVPTQQFRIPPILLHGSPGIGKTLFATELASALGLRCERVSASGMQGTFDLVGSSSHWSNAHPGRIYQLLARGREALAVLLIDEVDKVSTDTRLPVLPALLDLLEADSARVLRDECLGISFDASKLIIILTANDMNAIPMPLRSRAQAFEVSPPSIEQREMIVLEAWERLQRDTGRAIELRTGEAQRLANAAEVDLRNLHRLVRQSFGRAITQGEDSADFTWLSVSGRRSIGFL